MSDDDIKLDRRFLELKSGEEDDVARDLPLFLRGDVVPWERVLDERCAVILGEAGTGKTTEFRLRRKLLADSGRPAFFLAVEELADKQITALLDSDEEQRFSDWKTAEEIAYFFLDAVDEARLHNARSLPSALRNLERDLKGNLSRTRILISCRVSDWRAQRDRGEIQSILLKRDPKQEVKVFTLAPLVEQQVVLLATHHQVGNVEAFIRETQRAGAYSYLERPGDVAWLVAYWREQGAIGTYTELIASNVDRKLRESNPDRRPSMTPAKANLAATALAGLGTLQRKSSFVIPDGELDPERAATSLDPHAVLPDLTLGEIAELLTLPLFDAATYGRVRIHHRSVSEYLSARWLWSLMQRGLDPSEVERLLFQQTPSGPALPPELVQAAAWLATESSFIRERLMEVAPLALLEGGDPSSLPNETRQEVLQRLAGQYNGRERLFRSFDRVALRRLATSNLAQTINDLLFMPAPPAELLETLLRIIIEGRLEGCASVVTGIAVDPARPALVRADAIEAVAAVGDLANKEAAVHTLLGEQDIDPEIGGAAAEFLFPTPLDVTRLLQLLRCSAKPLPDKTTSLARVLGNRVYEKTPPADRARLLSGILEIVQDPAAGQARRWLLAPFAHLVVAHVSTCDDDVSRRSLRFLDEVARRLTFETRHDLFRVSDELGAMLRARPELRRFLFWEQAAQRAPNHRGRRTSYHAMSGTAPLWRISAADLDWLERDAVSRDQIADRLLAFDTFMAVPVPAERADEVQGRAERLAASDPALRKHFERRARKPEYAHPEAARWAREQQVLKNSQDRTRVVNLARLREHLEEIRSGELEGALIWLWHHAPSWDENKIDDVVRELTDQLGADVAGAAEEGWRRCWRTVECPLPHEERNVVCDTAAIGLAGISIDLRQGLDLASLSADAARRAARLATHAMNSFPPWIELLVRYHAPCVQSVFGACLRADFSAPAHHDVLGLLAHAPLPVQEVCVPVLEELIEAGDPEDTRVLEQVLDTLLPLPAGRAVLARLAPERCVASTSDLARFALWWAVWFAADPHAAVGSLATQIAADGERARDRVLALCEQILSWLEPIKQPGFGLPEHARALAAFLTIVLTYVHPSDDIRNGGGPRDDAERLRAMLIHRLAAMPGQETVDGLVQLANDPRWPGWHDWLLALAETRHADDLTVATNDVAAKLLKAYRAHGLAAPEHLAEAGLRIVSMTAGHEHPITEPRLPMQKYTILFLAANPIGIDQRALDREARAIHMELTSTGHRDRFDFVTRWAAEPLDLLRALRTLKPAVVHFSGHGEASGGAATRQEPAQGRDVALDDPERASRVGLYFQNANGEAQWVSADALAQAFGAAGSSVQLVVLNACYSDVQAAALLSSVPCVVGMTGAIDDAAARHFATGFYGGLGDGVSVSDAYQHGKAAISLMGLRDADKARIQTRTGVDAGQLVLGAHGAATEAGRTSASGAAPAARETPNPASESPPARPASGASGATASSARPHIDVGILTIRPDEFRAVLNVFPAKAGTGVYKSPNREYTLRYADAGHGERYTIAVLRQIEQGNGEAQDAARDLLLDLAPRLVLVVGIAGGLPSDVSLGDVVVATRIHDLTVEAREAGDTVTYDATGGPIDRSLAGAVANLDGREEMVDWSAGLPPCPSVSWSDEQLTGPDEWQNKLRAKLARHHGATAPARAPIYVAGPIASSDRLVKDPVVLFPWITTARKLVAVEMESGGVYRALRERCPMLPIRGISDIVGLQRSEEWIGFACASAAAFARAFLRTQPVPVGASSDASRPS